MFSTPPAKMVNTRSATARKNAATRGAASLCDDTNGQILDRDEPTPSQLSVKTEGFLTKRNRLHSERELPSELANKSRSSKRSTSSLMAQKKKLELEAAQSRAKIEMELIEKKLAADLAAVEERYSSHASGSVQEDGKDIEEWLERSHQELEKQQANAHGTLSGPQLQAEEVGSDGPVQQLVTALRELITSNTSANQNNNLLSRISTPRDLPVFYGDPMEWLAFRQAYDESTSLCNFSDKENLWRLRKCLRGPAKDAVSALLITTTAPTTILSTLELLYGNPDVILTKIMQDIKKLNPLSHEYYKEIVPFSIRVKNYVAAVRALHRDEYLQGLSMVDIVLSKLPTVLLSKWADFSYPLIVKGGRARLDILSDFLTEEAIKTSTCSANLINIRVDKRKYSDINQLQTVLLQSAESNDNTDNKCRFCRISKHKLPECKKFKRSLRRDRWTYVRRFGLCYKCLVSHHDRTTCPAAVCDVESCGEPHHRLLHYVPSSSRQNNNIPSAAGAVQLVTESDNICDDENTHLSDNISENCMESEIVTHIKTINNCSVLLKVVNVNIHGPNGVFSAKALLDDGSTVSLISAALATRVGARGRKQTLHVRGAWDNTELTCDTELVDLCLVTESERYNVSLRSVNKLNLPTQNLTFVNCENYTYLSDIKSDLCTGQLKPEILIGQDNYHLLLPLKILSGNRNEPCATLTPLGWCLHGRVECAAPSARVTHSTLHISEVDFTTEQDSGLNKLHEEVRRSFAIDSMGVSASSPRQNLEELRALEHLEKTSTLENGRWFVGLPWKDNDCVMPDSHFNALARLVGVERKMKIDKEYAERYKERIRHLLDNDYAEELKVCENTSKTWYLPHFGVDNPNKKKLRLVFDAAAKTSGLSLNDYLLKGPDLLMSLFGIMLRFRENRIAVTGDIKDMFLRIKIHEKDRDALRFVFRNNPYDNDTQNPAQPSEAKKSVKTYVMSSLIFGANCSPFIAQFIKNKNARRFESTMPLAVTAVYNQHYMDDYIDSVPDEETAIKLVQEIKYIHSQGNFELRNWNSNSQAVLRSLPQDTLGNMAVKFKIGEQHEGERTLGLIWFTHDDTLAFDISFKRIPECITNGQKIPTKREMLRVVMSIFDVYGFLSPFTINGKIILQETWRLDMDWDDQVPEVIYLRWKQWIKLLTSLRNVRLPRYYQSASASESRSKTETTNQTSLSTTRCLRHGGVAKLTAASSATPATSATPLALQAVDDRAPSINNLNCYRNLEMHIFCDASLKAFCAVAYWRWINAEGLVQVAFIASKCRVAGNKPITVPRLELQAAVLAARLADTITKEHKMTATNRYFWCDSTTVLHWIRNDARNYKTYVANRLGEIDDLTQMKEWRYVPTKINVADIGTRESYDLTVLEQEWLYGPAFLKNNKLEWPQDVVNADDYKCDPEFVTFIHANEEQLPVPEPTKFSSWLRLLKIMYRILTFIDRGMEALKRKFVDREYNYNLKDNRMRRAENLLLRYSQAQSFKAEISLLKKSESIPTSSKLLTLSAYLDQNGVLRAGGRIDAAPGVSSETKRPVILNGQDYIARLIVRHYHINAAHGNQETVVNELKQKYWIIRLRPTVKMVVSKCMTCRLNKCGPEIPRMGDLPEARMAHHQRPFSFCGVDLFGPMIVTVGRRHEKRYGVLFTCLTIRAVHVELVCTLTSDSLIMALRRMAARRGWPIQMFSDNGTNLRGADTEMKKAIKSLDEHKLMDEALNHGTEWTFIPPISPHWAGAWERLIRSVKTSLKIVLKERAPREETLITLLAEVENIVNSRPLTHVYVEAGSMETLTPNHFLLGSSSNLPQIGVFDDSDLFLRKQWRISQRLADLYWKRWVKEVLPEMIPRQKWNKEQRPLQVGDMVFIVDADGPRNVWPKGIIDEIFPGKDGRVRMVKIKTKSGTLVRSATRVARIPIVDECC